MKKTVKKSPRMQKKLAAKAFVVSGMPELAQPPSLQALPIPAAIATKLISLPQLMQLAKNNNEDALGNVSDQRALVIARAFFAELSRVLEELQDGAVVLPVLGTFTAERVFTEQDNQQNMARRVFFQPTHHK